MSADNAYAVELKGVSFKRGTRSIFNNVDIRIPRGKVTGIMGPSGCGKTTLLRLMGMQLRPSSGEVWVNNQNLPTLSRSDLFDARKHMVCCFRVVRCSLIWMYSRTLPSRCGCIPNCLKK